MSPSIAGLPGRMARPWKSSRPRAEMTLLTESRSPGGAAAGYDEDVAALQSPAYGGVERLYLVAYYAELHRLAAAAADQGAEHRGVHVPHLAGAGDAVGGHQLVAGA